MSWAHARPVRAALMSGGAIYRDAALLHLLDQAEHNLVLCLVIAFFSSLTRPLFDLRLVNLTFLTSDVTM